MNIKQYKSLELLDKYFKETPKEEIEAEINLISKLDVRNFALSICSVVKPFVCDRHPNARTYTSTTGKQCCVKCVMG